LLPCFTPSCLHRAPVACSPTTNQVLSIDGDILSSWDVPFGEGRRPPVADSTTATYYILELPSNAVDAANGSLLVAAQLRTCTGIDWERCYFSNGTLFKFTPDGSILWEFDASEDALEASDNDADEDGMLITKVVVDNSR